MNRSAESILKDSRDIMQIFDESVAEVHNILAKSGADAKDIQDFDFNAANLRSVFDLRSFEKIMRDHQN